MATVSSGQLITAAQYNDLQSRTNQVLGIGSGDSGYGQALTSSQVLTGNTVTAAQMDNLRIDINKCHNHQQGTDDEGGWSAVSSTRARVRPPQGRPGRAGRAAGQPAPDQAGRQRRDAVAARRARRQSQLDRDGERAYVRASPLPRPAP